MKASNKWVLKIECPSVYLILCSKLEASLPEDVKANSK